MRIALAQIAAGTDPDVNLATVAEHTARAAADGARLVVFPEATMCRFGTSLREIAEPFDGRWADGVRAVADEHGVTVVAGMFCPAGDGRITNTLLATGGGVAARYDKIHLYDAFGFTESRTVAPGDRAVLIEVDGVTVGLTTCYDIRFPELYVELARRGATLITVSASWGAGPGKAEQWTLLARARALDVGGYVAAVDQAYPGAEIAKLGPTGVGASLLASPWGEPLVTAGAEPSLLMCDIDPAVAVTAREPLGVLTARNHR
jgi:predicted amidohydrolase